MIALINLSEKSKRALTAVGFPLLVPSSAEYMGEQGLLGPQGSVIHPDLRYCGSSKLIQRPVTITMETEMNMYY